LIDPDLFFVIFVFCEQLILPSQLENDDPDAVLCNKLMMEIYSRINEPDGIYGLNRDTDVEAQIVMYEHESAWFKTAGTYDTVLQHASKTETDSTSLVRNTDGLLSSLLNLGHYHLLDVYLSTEHTHSHFFLIYLFFLTDC
jgi:hypothetical protein